MQSLEKSREHRFATATAFLQALDEAEAPTEASGGVRAQRAAGSHAGAGGGAGAGSRAGARPGGRPRWSAVALVVRRHRGRQDAMAGTRPRWSRRRPSRRPRRPTWPTATRRSRAGWRTATSRPRAARWNRRCPSGPRTGASVTCWGAWPTPTTSTRRRWALPGSDHARRGLPRRSGAAVPPRHVAGRAPAGRRRAGPGDREDRRARGRPAGEGRQRRHRPRRGGSAPPLRWTTSARASASIRCRCRSSSSRRPQSCEEKKVIVVKLKGLGDVRALPALRALGGRRLGPLRFGGADTRCMRKELAEAIAALDDKDEKEAARPRARRGGDAADERRCATTRRTCSPAWCWCSRCSSSTRSASCSRCRC